MKNIFLVLVLSLSASSFANLAQPELVYIQYAGPYAFPEPVKMAVVNALTDSCFYHQSSHHWRGKAQLVPGSTYSYKVQMAGEDAQIPHHYIYSSMVVEFDAVLGKARSIGDLKCSQGD